MYYRVKHKEGIGHWVLYGIPKKFLFCKWIYWQCVGTTDLHPSSCEKEPIASYSDAVIRIKAHAKVIEDSKVVEDSKGKVTLHDYPHPETQLIASEFYFF